MAKSKESEPGEPAFNVKKTTVWERVVQAHDAPTSQAPCSFQITGTL